MKKLEEMSKDELKEKATELGVEFKARDTNPVLIALIEAKLSENSGAENEDSSEDGDETNGANKPTEDESGKTDEASNVQTTEEETNKKEEKIEDLEELIEVMGLVNMQCRDGNNLVKDEKASISRREYNRLKAEKRVTFKDI